MYFTIYWNLEAVILYNVGYIRLLIMMLNNENMNDHRKVINYMKAEKRRCFYIYISEVAYAY